VTQISLPYNPQPGGAEDITQINANFAAVLAVVNGDIRNDNVAAAAAIAYSKLNLANAIKNGDVDPAAAIAVSKLAAGADSRKILGMAGGVPTWRDDQLYNKNTSSVGTGAATVETDLLTITLAANDLTVGDFVHIRAAGTMSGVAGSKTVRLYFGSTVLLTSTELAANPGDWSFDALVIVTGASAQKASAMFLDSGGINSLSDYTTPSAAISGAITVKTTGQTTNAGDEITCEMLAAELIPA